MMMIKALALMTNVLLKRGVDFHVKRDAILQLLFTVLVEMMTFLYQHNNCNCYFVVFSWPLSSCAVSVMARNIVENTFDLLAKQLVIRPSRGVFRSCFY